MATKTRKSSSKSNGRADNQKELVAKVKALLKDGKTVAEMSKTLHLQPTRVQVLRDIAEVKPKERIEPDDKATMKALREDGLSFSKIAARAGISIPAVKKLVGSTKPKASAAPARKRGDSAKATTGSKRRTVKRRPRATA